MKRSDWTLETLDHFVFWLLANHQNTIITTLFSILDAIRHSIFEVSLLSRAEQQQHLATIKVDAFCNALEGILDNDLDSLVTQWKQSLLSSISTTNSTPLQSDSENSNTIISHLPKKQKLSHVRLKKSQRHSNTTATNATQLEINECRKVNESQIPDINDDDLIASLVMSTDQGGMLVSLASLWDPVEPLLSSIEESKETESLTTLFCNRKALVEKVVNVVKRYEQTAYQLDPSHVEDPTVMPMTRVKFGFICLLEKAIESQLHDLISNYVENTQL